MAGTSVDTERLQNIGKHRAIIFLNTHVDSITLWTRLDEIVEWLNSPEVVLQNLDCAERIFDC